MATVIVRGVAAALATHIAAALFEIEHHIADALSGSVIGELATASGLEHGKACVEQIAVLRARAGGVDGRMLHEPDEFAGLAVCDGSGTGLHERDGFGIGREAGRDAPLDIGF